MPTKETPGLIGIDSKSSDLCNFSNPWSLWNIDWLGFRFLLTIILNGNLTLFVNVFKFIY